MEKKDEKEEIIVSPLRAGRGSAGQSERAGGRWWNK